MEAKVALDTAREIPTIILPTQWKDLHHHPALEAEHRLIFAVLESGIADATTPRAMRLRTIYWKARAWVESAREEPFGFIWCCEELGVAAERLRTAVLASKVSIGPAKSPVGRHGRVVQERYRRKEHYGDRRIRDRGNLQEDPDVAGHPNGG